MQTSNLFIGLLGERYGHNPANTDAHHALVESLHAAAAEFPPVGARPRSRSAPHAWSVAADAAVRASAQMHARALRLCRSHVPGGLGDGFGDAAGADEQHAAACVVVLPARQVLRGRAAEGRAAAVRVRRNRSVRPLMPRAPTHQPTQGRPEDALLWLRQPRKARGAEGRHPRLGQAGALWARCSADCIVHTVAGTYAGSAVLQASRAAAVRVR